jgi:hypothetical protein
VEEMSKLRELPDRARREMVIGHAATSLTFLSDLLLSPNNELAMAKRANEDLLAEVAKWKTSAEAAERVRGTMATEVQLSKQACGNFNRELDSMAQKLEEARGDRDEYRIQLNMSAKRTAEVEMRLTSAKAETAKAKRRTTEVKKLARTKLAEAQRVLDELCILKYLEGYKDGTENTKRKHNTADLDAIMSAVDSAEEEDSEDSSAEESEDEEDGEDVKVVGDETVLADQAPPSAETSNPGEEMAASEEASLPEGSTKTKGAPSSADAAVAEGTTPPPTNVSEE